MINLNVTNKKLEIVSQTKNIQIKNDKKLIIKKTFAV